MSNNSALYAILQKIKLILHEFGLKPHDVQNSEDRKYLLFAVTFPHNFRSTLILIADTKISIETDSELPFYYKILLANPNAFEQFRDHIQERINYAKRLYYEEQL